MATSSGFPAAMNLSNHLFLSLIGLLLTGCSPKPSAKEIALQNRITALEARIHVLELDRALTPGSAFNRFPNLREEARATAELATQKARWEVLKNLPDNERPNSLLALGLAGPNMQQLQRNLMDQEVEIAALKVTHQPNHPKMLALQAELQATREDLDRAAAEAMSGLETQLQISTRWVEALKKNQVAAP